MPREVVARHPLFESPAPFIPLHSPWRVADAERGHEALSVETGKAIARHIEEHWGAYADLMGHPALEKIGLLWQDNAWQPTNYGAAFLALANLVGKGWTYFDPHTGVQSTAFECISWIGACRHNLARSSGLASVTGISRWKQKRVAALFRTSDGPALAASMNKAVSLAKAHSGAIGYWPSRVNAEQLRLADSEEISTWQMEDGFIRSNGLGSKLNLPCSLVIDRCGIYYDPNCPSDLENMLEVANFSVAQCRRAERLVSQLVTSGVTKYNLMGSTPELPMARRLILVIGQVENDRSVLLGGGNILSMRDLLQRARLAEPESFIIYKPHPDIVAGMRPGARSLSGLADLVMTNASLTALFDKVDAVHVLTSLAGFEALLRGKEVVVHGQPFYAGWGLTRDLFPIDRRTRRRTLVELVAAALIGYPSYVHPQSELPCAPEQLIDILAAEEAEPRSEGRLLLWLASWIARRRQDRAAK